MPLPRTEKYFGAFGSAELALDFLQHLGEWVRSYEYEFSENYLGVSFHDPQDIAALYDGPRRSTIHFFNLA